jgi:putative PIN family toxin of toxin-antitoxin system
MQLVVLDTNIIVSAFLSPHGTPALVLAQVMRQNIKLAYDTRILSEYLEVLSRPKFNFDQDRLERFSHFLSRHGLSVLAKPSTIPLDDETDRMFYEVAATCSALLISSNLKHYPKASFILSPTTYWQEYSEEQN